MRVYAAKCIVQDENFSSRSRKLPHRFNSKWYFVLILSIQYRARAVIIVDLSIVDEEELILRKVLINQ